jgi:hypothetical protein
MRNVLSWVTMLTPWIYGADMSRGGSSSEPFATWLINPAIGQDVKLFGAVLDDNHVVRGFRDEKHAGVNPPLPR